MPGDSPSPGDITITAVYSGFLVARVLREVGKGPGWEYVALLRTETEALERAQQAASGTDARLWLQDPTGTMRPLPRPNTGPVERATGIELS
jgi:hypothetical protein